LIQISYSGEGFVYLCSLRFDLSAGCSDMEDTRVTLLALGLLVVALVVILGSVVLSPSTLVLLATLGAWANLTFLVGLCIKR